MLNPLHALLGLVSRDVGIDLGTTNTLVLVRGKGIVVNEPSVVAVHRKTRRVLAVGREAKRMSGVTPQDVLVVRPLQDGVIYDAELAEALLRYVVDQAHADTPFAPRARVVVGVPSGVTEVEKRAVHEATLHAGSRESWLIEEPIAAAIGAGLPITEPTGSMIVDIGGGTTEVAVLSLGGVVSSGSIRVAGDEMDQDIVTYLRQRFDLVIGERTAEATKIGIGRAAPVPGDAGQAALVRGRDVRSGGAREVEVSSGQIAEAISPSVQAISDLVAETLEETPPEVLADLMARGITLAGGGALLPGLPELLAQRVHVAVHVADEPLGCVVRGAGRVLNELDTLRQVLVDVGAKRYPRSR